MNQEKQREAYQKMLKKCPDILTPMKAARWSPAVRIQSTPPSKTVRLNPIPIKAVTSSPKMRLSTTLSGLQTIKAEDIPSEVIRNVEQFTASAVGRTGAVCFAYQQT